MEKIILNNGVEIPVLGLGTYRIGRTEEEVYGAVRSALEIGYRHIDTAAFYRNEQPIGRAMRDSGISREDIFLTTKLWGSDIIEDNVEGAFEMSLKNLGTDYIDLYLVHWPVRGKVGETWRKMESIYHSGKARAIGLSNHLRHHIEEILENATITPAVNQVELHPYLMQEELIKYCRAQQIAVQAWSPLGSSKIPLLEEPALREIGAKYGKSAAQVVIRWHLEKEMIVIPKSSSPGRQAENFRVFDFRLSDDEVARVDALDRGHRTGIHPNEIEF